jgi:hypothetical protein
VPTNSRIRRFETLETRLELVGEGARRMLAEALRAEMNADIAQFADQRDKNGHRLVVRNGYHGPREVAAGAVELTTPRVNSPPGRPGNRLLFTVFGSWLPHGRQPVLRSLLFALLRSASVVNGRDKTLAVHVDRANDRY